MVDYSEQIPHTPLLFREELVQILKGHEILPHLKIFNVFIYLYIDTPNNNFYRTLDDVDMVIIILPSLIGLGYALGGTPGGG